MQKLVREVLLYHALPKVDILKRDSESERDDVNERHRVKNELYV
jgi:hypothetical protein